MKYTGYSHGFSFTFFHHFFVFWCLFPNFSFFLLTFITRNGFDFRCILDFLLFWVGFISRCRMNFEAFVFDAYKFPLRCVIYSSKSGHSTDELIVIDTTAFARYSQSCAFVDNGELIWTTSAFSFFFFPWILSNF